MRKKHDYNRDIKEQLIDIIKRKNNYKGAEYLKDWIDLYNKEENEPKKNLIKFCIYRLSSELEDEEISSFDCDVCENVTESYLKTYKYLKEFQLHKQSIDGRDSSMKYELSNGEVVYRGDTMTSVWTIVKEYVKQKTQTYEIEEDDRWEYFILRNINEIDISENMGQFIKLCHTEGNFIPVPMGFNTGRSNFGKWDSWDLTLSQIYEWYRNNSGIVANHEALEKLFSTAENQEYCVSQCVMWLRQFKTWNNFIEQNYLQPFVNKNDTPIVFFENHSLSNALPKSLDEFESFVQTVNECITKRIELLEKKHNPLKRLTISADVIGVTLIGISDIIAVSYSIFILIKALMQGVFSEQWALVKKFKLGEIVNQLGTITTLNDWYYSGFLFKISLLLLSISVIFIFITGICNAKGIFKGILIIFSAIPIIGFPIWVWAIWRYYNYPITEAGRLWVERVGKGGAAEQYYAVLKQYAIVGIVLGVIFLIAVICHLIKEQTREMLLWTVLSVLGITILIPLIFFLLENLLPIIGIVIILLIVALGIKIIGLLTDTEVPSISVVEVFDKDGKFLGWFHKDK